MKVGGHRITVGDRVRSRRDHRSPWFYGTVVKIEAGIMTVRFKRASGYVLAEWIMAEVPWRYEHGMVEFKSPEAPPEAPPWLLK